MKFSLTLSSRKPLQANFIDMFKDGDQIQLKLIRCYCDISAVFVNVLLLDLQLKGKMKNETINFSNSTGTKQR